MEEAVCYIDDQVKTEERTWEEGRTGLRPLTQEGATGNGNGSEVKGLSSRGLGSSWFGLVCLTPLLAMKPGGPWFSDPRWLLAI